MLIPSRTKYRRVHRLPYEGHTKGNKTLDKGEYGLMAKEGAWITANQIEAARVAMTRYGIDDMRLLYENDVRFLEQF